MFLGVSDDTVRRWIEKGTLEAAADARGRTVIEGTEVARMARELAVTPELAGGARSSARNRFVGIVTNVVMDTVMAQVQLQCGPFRVVSLMSSEAARELGLEPGKIASAVIEAEPAAAPTGPSTPSTPEGAA